VVGPVQGFIISFSFLARHYYNPCVALFYALWWWCIAVVVYSPRLGPLCGLVIALEWY